MKKEKLLLPETISHFLEWISNSTSYPPLPELTHEMFVKYSDWKTNELLSRQVKKKSAFEIPEGDIIVIRKILSEHNLISQKGENKGLRQVIHLLLYPLEAKYGFGKAEILRQLARSLKLKRKSTKFYTAPQKKTADHYTQIVDQIRKNLGNSK
jgi:hypothetical protein